MASAAALLVNATLNGVTKVVKSCHSKMNASNTTAPMASMDHSQMDHSKMDHSKMDHSQMNHGNLHDGMVMTFHGGYNEQILFDFWETKTIPLFLLSCVALFVFAALYEGLKLLREILIKRDMKNRKDLIDQTTKPTITNCHCKPLNEGTSIQLTPNDHKCCSSKTSDQTASLLIQANGSQEVVVIKSYSSRLLSKGHLIQTLLHMLQIAVSYMLMLVFMTYNSWLCLSVVLGAGLGYFVFGLQRLTSIDVNEHCH